MEELAAQMGTTDQIKINYTSEIAFQGTIDSSKNSFRRQFD